MIHVTYIGRLGNNMIQYSLARFLADQKGYELTYDTVGETALTHMHSIFPNTTKKIQGINLTKNPLTIGYDNKTNHVQTYNIDQLLQHDGLIHLNGFFQKHNFFMANRKKICEYFDYEKANLKSADQYDVVIHIRLGDYVTLGHYITPAKIYQLYKKLDFKRALIISDDITNQLLTDFQQDVTCFLENNTLLQDLHYLATCKNAIISQSTFSWWGTYLGDVKNIYVPYDQSQNYPWPYNPNKEDIDLIPSKPEYHKIIV